MAETEFNFKLKALHWSFKYHCVRTGASLMVARSNPFLSIIFKKSVYYNSNWLYSIDIHAHVHTVLHTYSIVMKMESECKVVVIVFFIT